MTFPIIGFAGRATHGKTHVALCLSRYLAGRGIPAARASFAYSLKSVTAELLEQVAPELNVYDHVYGLRKDAPIEKLQGLTAREIMKSLGTDWARSFYQDIWVNALDSRLPDLKKTSKILIIDDVRFQNEVDYIYEQGGTVVFINKHGERLPSDRRWWEILLSFFIAGPHITEQLSDEGLPVYHNRHGEDKLTIARSILTYLPDPIGAELLSHASVEDEAMNGVHRPLSF